MPKVYTATAKGRKRQQTTGERGRLYPGETYLGLIVDHDYVHQTYTVNILGEAVSGCVDMSSNTAALFGFKTINRLTPGTAVRLVYGLPSWIIGTTAFDPPDTESHTSRIITGTGIADALTKTNPANGTVPPTGSPDDLYQGEFEITNLLGTFIRFMTFMSSIGGSERAKIECHLLRDLVRIVSTNFEHFSSNGDLKIFNDGRLTTELNGTTYEHERWGNLKANDPKFEMKNTGMPEVDPQDTGRWRYTCLLGFIGDLFNSWFTDPAATVGRLAEECMRAGKARIHVGQDGGILVQSCSEIVMEHVTRIPVPIRISHEEDPQGVLMKEMDQLDSKFLKVWDTGGVTTEHHTLFQLREYVRYLNQYHSLARIHQLSKDWAVPAEADAAAPDVGAGEEDRTKANKGLTYWKDCYSTIRIFRDGSTLIYDTYGNAVATGPYGVQISSTRHIHHYAAGDIVLKAGGSLFLSARRHIEIMANRGALLLKARTSLRALCEVGTLWLKSDMDPDKPYTPVGDDPAAERLGKQGVRIQSVAAESWWISKLKSRIMVEKADERLELSSAGTIALKSLKNLEFNIKESFTAVIGRAISFTARGWQNWLRDGWSIDRVCHLRPGTSKLNNLETTGLMSRGPVGGPKHGGQLTGDSKCCYKPHDNHLSVYEPKGEFSLSLLTVPETVPLEDAPTGFIWKSLPYAEYKWSNVGLADQKIGFDFEPLSQQAIRLSGSSNYGDWSQMADAFRTAPQTATDTPWPGPEFKWALHNTSAPDLQVPTDRPPTEFGPETQTGLTLGRPTFKFLKRS